ncbi:hypothetical protein Golax_022940 [Gossypium laxum]|uniref:Uncharacterized protein n=1 Tax=Gossypium laxum TaxID=34288 RepID=A0A7J9AZ62_9ROSI|nr:hypothetical protein [Gossypium laxum]
MLMNQSPIYSTSLIRGLHQSRQFWQKPSGFHSGFSLKIIHH